jgi:hypothetical protein
LRAVKVSMLSPVASAISRNVIPLRRRWEKHRSRRQEVAQLLLAELEHRGELQDS